MRVLAVDLGLARTGIAISDPSGTLATPRCVFEGYGRTRLTAAVKELIEQENIGLVIVGYPERTDGKESEMAQKAVSFATFLSKRTPVPVKLVNEAYTTVIATAKLHDNDIKVKDQRSKIDMAAAAVLLQGYLDSSKE